MSPELGDDPEATFDLGDVELMSDVYATLRAVIRACRFDGTVTAKNECAGGVAGRCEAGAILDCAARGNVETEGDYCGGIAGRTRGKVERCAALVDLTAQSWLGGVAGLAQDITDCRTMVRADSDGECQGAIAGQADGTLSGNRYLLEDLAGLDGVDYEGTAQGLDFAAFSQLSYIPADFLTLSYRFEVDGKTVAEIPFSYGEDLDLSQVPGPPAKWPVWTVAVLPHAGSAAFHGIAGAVFRSRLHSGRPGGRCPGAGGRHLCPRRRLDGAGRNPASAED